MPKNAPPLWQAILDRLDPDLPSNSLDSVHSALGGAVGRGTLQRIRNGTPGTTLSSLRSIADALGCDASELLMHAAPEARSSAGGNKRPTLQEALGVIRDQLLLTQERAIASAAGEALHHLALSPDSDRAFSEAVDILVALPNGGVQILQTKGADDITASNATWRKEAMRLAETATDPGVKAIVVGFLGMVDTVMRAPIEQAPAQARSKSKG